MPPGAEKVVAANMMGPPELIEYSIIVFEAVTKKIKSEVRIQAVIRRSGHTPFRTNG
jgi:hypothetical protein